MRKPWIVGVALSVCLSASVGASDATTGRKEAAVELLRSIKTEEMTAVLEAFERRISEDPQVAPYREQLLQLLASTGFWDFTLSHVADAYARAFTEPELREIIAFYETPVGKKMVSQTPALMQEEKKIVDQFFAEHRAELEAVIRAPGKGAEPHAQPDAQGGAAPPSSKEPAPEETLLDRANRFYDAEKWADARDAYSEYLKSDPDNVDALTDLGSCDRQLGDSEAALREFDRALALDPDHWQTLFNKVIVVGFDLKRTGDAQILLTRLKALQPDNADVEKLAARLAKQ